MNQTDLVMFLIKNPDVVDQLLVQLDEAAKQSDPYEFGLPVYNDMARAQLRMVVARWAADMEMEDQDEQA